PAAGAAPAAAVAAAPAAPPAVAAAPAATAAAAAAVLTGLGLVDREAAALVHGAVEGGDGLVAAVLHLHEPEAARAARLPVGDDLGLGDPAVLPEQLAEVVRGGVEGEVADVDVLHALLLAHGPLCEDGMRGVAAEDSCT